MIIDNTEKPFPFLLVRDFYTSDELSLIWKELDFLTRPEIMVPGNMTNPNVDATGVYSKKNKVHFLDEVYTNRQTSNILTLNRKVVQPDVITAFADLNFGYNAIKNCNVYYTQVGYYENADYYKSHSDAGNYTALTWLFKEPKKFSGGNLTFTDYGYTIEIENNMMAIFPSFVLHEVDEIKLDDMSTNNGRYVIAQFLNMKDPQGSYNYR